MNSCHFMGRLTRDVETRFLPNNTAVADFGLAVNERVKRDGQWVDEPVYLDVTAFGTQAESIAKFFGRGSLIALECRAKFDQWQDKQTAQKRHKVKFIVTRWHFAGEKRDNPQRGGAWSDAPAPARTGTHDPVDESDIPF